MSNNDDAEVSLAPCITRRFVPQLVFEIRLSSPSITHNIYHLSSPPRFTLHSPLINPIYIHNRMAPQHPSPSTEEGDLSSPPQSPTTSNSTSTPAADVNHHQYIQGRYLHRLPPFDAPQVRRVFTSSRLAGIHTSPTSPASPTDRTPLLQARTTSLKKQQQHRQFDADERAVVVIREPAAVHATNSAAPRPRPPTPLPSFSGGAKGGPSVGENEGEGGKLKFLTRRLSSAGSHAATVAASAIKRTSSIKGGHVRRGSSSSARSGGEGDAVASKWGWTWLKKEKRWERRRHVEGGGLSVEEDGEEEEVEGGAGPAFR